MFPVIPIRRPPWVAQRLPNTAELNGCANEMSRGPQGTGLCVEPRPLTRERLTKINKPLATVSTLNRNQRRFTE
ncbi:hypothetical protein GCM10023156_52130 [Novipirellula rosea]|uniref:Uncharacterized protein n=1 Tax=Novipirellula rosea TaxID=1031540 RepID=A0ABP8NGF0_9BACT